MATIGGSAPRTRGFGAAPASSAPPWGRPGCGERMVRDGDYWRVVTWDEAFRRCADLIGPVVAAHGMQAVTAYIGNPTVHNYSLSRFSGAIPGIPRMPVVWSAGTVDQWPK